VGGIIFFSFTAFFEPIQQEFGWSYTQISLATSLRGLTMGIFAPIVGFLVDRFGSRKLLLGGTIVIGIGLVLLSFTQSLLMFYLCFLFIALGAGGCTSVVTMTAVAIWFKKNVGLALGIVLGSASIGGIIGPTLAGWAFDTLGSYTSVWYGLCGISGIAIFLIMKIKPSVSPSGTTLN
jgi:MFS family permease